MQKELTPAQVDQIVQDFLTIKTEGNRLKYGGINELDRICGVRCYTVERICKQAAKVIKNERDHYPSESKKVKLRKAGEGLCSCK